MHHNERVENDHCQLLSSFAPEKYVLQQDVRSEAQRAEENGSCNIVNDLCFFSRSIDLRFILRKQGHNFCQVSPLYSIFY